MPLTTLSLLDLPPELILEIGDYLPPDGILALKFSHSIFNRTLPLSSRLRNTTLSDCARLAIRTYLSPPDPKPSHLRCILCKAIYPASLFKSSSSPACVPTSLTADAQQTDVVELPHRLCSWHVGRLARVIHTEPGGRNEWVGHVDKMCMHCGAVQGWTKCDCLCDSCSFRSVKTYTRYLNNSTECRKFLFWRNTTEGNQGNVNEGDDGQLWVRETCYDPGATNKNPVINLPVRFEDLMSDGAMKAQVCSVTSQPQRFTFNAVQPRFLSDTCSTTQ